MRRLISEPITPEYGPADPAPTGGEPQLPRRFRWRDETVDVATIEDQWNDTTPCTHGSGERYRRRHWYDVRSAEGRRFRVYFDRRESSPRRRWWLFSETVSE